MNMLYPNINPNPMTDNDKVPRIGVAPTDRFMLRFENARNYETRRWTSEKTKKSYGTRWYIVLKDFDAKLHIEPVIEHQEIPSSINKFSKYEGSASVTGTYEGKRITGRTTIEIIKI